MSKFDNIRTGLTFDDVLLVPLKSDVLPGDVSLKTHLTRDIELNIPIVSAAMDTVTESAMAIALAREGGLGFIHKNMSIEAQAKQVDLVKRNEAGMIIDPVVLSKDATTLEAYEKMEEYNVSGLPIVDDERHLVGIITSRDLKYLAFYFYFKSSNICFQQFTSITFVFDLGKCLLVKVLKYIQFIPPLDTHSTLL